MILKVKSQGNFMHIIISFSQIMFNAVKETFTLFGNRLVFFYICSRNFLTLETNISWKSRVSLIRPTGCLVLKLLVKVLVRIEIH